MKVSLDPRRLVALFVICGTLLGGSAAALARDIAVVVHPAVPVDNLSFAELRKIMLGDRQFWPSGQKVTLVVAEPVDPGRTLLLEKVYKMSEPAFRQYWIAKVFRGEVTEGPKVVLSSEGIQELVTVMEGAIAFMDFDDVPAGLKVLRIDGKAPGEDGYPLQLE